MIVRYRRVNALVVRGEVSGGVLELIGQLGDAGETSVCNRCSFGGLEDAFFQEGHLFLERWTWMSGRFMKTGWVLTRFFLLELAKEMLFDI